MRSYRCPLCDHTLSKREYDKVLKIHEGQHRHVQHVEDLLKREQAARRKQRAEFDARVKSASQNARDRERAKTQRLVKGKDSQIRNLKQLVDNLKRGTTPQTDGLEDEAILARRLRRTFPSDDVQHKGKGGDVLQVVRLRGRVAGRIVYECKNTARIDSAHIRQARRAKHDRDAEFAVLVTTGRRRGFSGFESIDGVLVVAPLGAIPLAGLLREHLGEMLKAQVSQGERARIAQRLVGFITGPQFKNAIDDTIRRATELQSILRQEANDHYRVWKRRLEHYRTIEWRGTQVHDNVQAVLRGDRPVVKTLKVAPLALPGPNGIGRSKNLQLVGK